VDTPSGRYRFDGSGSLVATVGSGEDGFAYNFTGTYFLVEQPPTDADGIVPEPLALHDGGFRLELGFWPDGKSLYSVSLILSEA
jgi:hypothetical protein